MAFEAFERDAPRISRRMLIFGGRSATGEYLGDLVQAGFYPKMNQYRIPNRHYQWEHAEVVLGSLPSPRAGHSFTACLPYDQDETVEAYIFGGENGSVCFLEFYRLTYLQHDEENGVYQYRIEDLSGDLPITMDGRHGHVAVYDGDGDPLTGHPRLIIFGGMGMVGAYKNDVWQYDIETGIWSKIDTAGTALPSVAYAAGVYDARNRSLLVQGGWDGSTVRSEMFALDLQTYDWRQVDLGAQSPGARCGHTASYGPFLLTGGAGEYSASATADEELGREAWLLDEPSRIWDVAMEGTQAPFHSLRRAVRHPGIWSGDEIRIHPGEYEEKVEVEDKILTIRSASGNPEDTILWQPLGPTPTPAALPMIVGEKGVETDYVLILEAPTTLEDLTICHAQGGDGWAGTGIVFYGGCDVRNCHIRDNHTGLSMYCVSGKGYPTRIEGCDVYRNDVGIIQAETFHEIIGNDIHDNVCCGIRLDVGTRGRITRNRIFRNGDPHFTEHCIASLNPHQGGARCINTWVYSVSEGSYSYQFPDIFLNTFWDNYEHGIIIDAPATGTAKGVIPIIRDNIFMKNDVAVGFLPRTVEGPQGTPTPLGQPQHCWPFLLNNDIHYNGVNFDHPEHEINRWASSTSIDLDPRFADPGPPDEFHLVSWSGCRDRGSLWLEPEYSTTAQAGSPDWGELDLGFHHLHGDGSMILPVGNLGAAKSGDLMTVSWENPTEYADGSPAEDRTGTLVYWLDMETLEHGTVYVEKGAESVEVPGLDPTGDYRVGAAAYNEDGAKGELAVAEVE